MSIKRIILLLAAVILALPSFAQTRSELESTVKSIAADENMKHGTLAVSVFNISQQRWIYRYNNARSVMPASISKLFTTACGFETLTSRFRFKTTLAYSGTIQSNGILNGSLYIIGGGDPLLGSYRYKQTVPDTIFNIWHHALLEHGIKGITGDIYYDASIYEKQCLQDTWEWGDLGNYYGMGAYGLNFHENMYFAYFNSGLRQGHPAIVDHVRPTGLPIRNICEVTTAAERSGDNVIVYGDPSSNVRTYKGTIPLNQRNFAIRGAMPNPPEACATLFANYLIKNNIDVPAHSIESTSSKHDDLTTLVEYFSNTYYVIAQYTNQTSNNLYAESIFKYLGYNKYGKGTFENGAKVINDYFKSHAFSTGGVNVVDGSGLSRHNRVTTDFLCQFLAYISSTDYYSEFLRSMGKVGLSGTARNVHITIPTGSTMYLKTGTMRGIKAFTGYFTNAKGETICFAVISNDHTCASSVAQNKLERILAKISAL